MSKVKLEVGKTYELNNGEVHECMGLYGDDPLAVDDCGYGPFVLGGLWYHQDGCYGIYDLSDPYSVKRVIDVPETGTLKELRVKAGDVVKATHWDEDTPVSDFYQDVEWTIYEKHPRGFFNNLCAVYTVNGGGWTYPEEDVKFRIVSRASDTPKLWRKMTDDERQDIPQHYRDDPTNPLALPFYEMSDVGKGAILLAWHEGKSVEAIEPYNDEDTWEEWFGGVQNHLGHRIRSEPVREVVELYGFVHNNDWYFSSVKDSRATHHGTFETEDGKPDCTTIKMGRL